MNWLKNAPCIQIDKTIDALDELSNVELQRRRWNFNDQGEMSSFVEARESLFDDSGLGDEIEKGRSGLTTQTVAALAALSAALQEVDPDRSPNEVIDSQAMSRVRELAGEALELLRSEAGQPSDDTERT
jgi:hypothetical protein